MARPVPTRDTHTPPRASHRYHLHWPGLLYLAVTLFIAIGAINGQNNLLFAALGVAAGALVVSGIMSGGGLWQLRIDRLRPSLARVGEQTTIHYILNHRGRFWPAFALHIEDLDADPEALGTVRAFAPRASPVRVTDALGTITPRRRGEHRLDRVRVWSTFPFGLMKKSLTASVPATLIALPARATLRPGLLAELGNPRHGGPRTINAEGHADEFFGVRDYRRGDAPRAIAWRASARRGTLVSRLWTTTHRRSLSLALRRDPSETPADTERSIILVAAIIEAADREGFAVDLDLTGIPARNHRTTTGTTAMLIDLARLDIATIPIAAATHGAVTVQAASIVSADRTWTAAAALADATEVAAP